MPSEDFVLLHKHQSKFLMPENSEIKSYFIKGATEISDSFNPMNLTVDF